MCLWLFYLAQEGVESVGTASTNPFVLKDLHGGHGQFNNPFATTTIPVSSDQQLGQTVRRSLSADWQYTSQKGTNGQLQQDVVSHWNLPNSAPVLHGGEFLFPDKQSSSFYIPRIQVLISYNFKNYLSLCQQRVVRNGAYSSWTTVEYGASQRLCSRAHPLSHLCK